MAKKRGNNRSQELIERIHPRLGKWFVDEFGELTEAQILCVPSVLARRSILLTSPTGSGKTLAGFLGVFDFLLRKIERGEPIEGVQCIYVSPLRALAYDIEKNLRGPIVGMGLEKELPIHLRTGDTTQANRAKFRRNGAPFLILGSTGGRTLSFSSAAGAIFFTVPLEQIASSWHNGFAQIVS